MPDELTAATEALWRDVQERVGDGREGPRLLQRLEELIRRAPEGSAPWAYACCELAERCMAGDPWRASVLARRVTRALPDEHRGWGQLGLSQSLLGHHAYAARAYHQALRRQPDNPWYAHNLGHLHDVMGDPRRGLPLLHRALAIFDRWEDVPGVDLERAREEVTASLAHALLNAGQPLEARAVMREVMRRTPRPEHHELYNAILEAEERLTWDADPPVRRRRVARRAST